MKKSNTYKGTKIVVLDYVKIGNYDTLMYVINGDGEQEFRYINGENKRLKTKSKSPSRFFKSLINLKDINDVTQHEIIIWMYELGSKYVFPEQKYLKYMEEVRQIASSK